MAWAIFGDEQIRAIGEMISSKSPRILAVVGGALLDEALRRTLQERLRDHKSVRDKLLKINQPLGNSGPKNDLLYMLRAYEKPVWKAIDGIISTRNFFAHNLDASFDSIDHSIEQVMAKLQLHEGRTFYPHQIYDRDSSMKIETIKTKRDVFTINLQLCLIALMRDRVSHETWSNRPFTDEEQKAKFPEHEDEKRTGIIRL